jgi:hypothetical protein
VVRAGFGIFYDRFSLGNTVAALRYNGILQQQYVITNPDFYPAVPSVGSLGVSPRLQSTQEVDSHLQSPYLIQSALTLERQLPRSTTLAITYTNAHALHVLRSQDINAPVPGTYAGPGTGVYPYPAQGPIFLMASGGLYRVVFGGSINTRWNLRFNPLVTFTTGAPFNITTGGDPYGTTLYTARPGIGADPSKPGLIQTPYGLLDPNPTPGEKTLGRNSGRGPFQTLANLRVSKTWGFGAEKTQSGPAPSRTVFSNPASRRFNVTLGMSARNLLNHNNPGTIIGNITSPLFGQANQVAGGANGEGFSENASNRRLEMQLRFVY